MGEREIAEYLTRAKRPTRLPVVLSQSEVRSVLRELRGVPRLCALLMYGAGLRVTETVSLRVKDLDFERHEILVRGGKGDKDRRVPHVGDQVARSGAGMLVAFRVQRGADHPGWGG